MYTVKSISESLKQILHKYLEADYHIWDESLIVARQHLLRSENLTSSDPRLEASPTYKSGVPFLKMDLPPVASEFLTSLSNIKDSGVYAEPRAHQRVALEKFLGDEKDIIVATGTGSGKTECFLYPILGNFAIEGERNKSQVQMPGCRVLLIYPMNALVNDQLTRLRKMFGNKDVSSSIEKVRGRRATFAVYTSKTDYPGARNDKKDKKLIAKIKELYTGEALNKKDELWAEGLWPAKDMEGFINNSLNTSNSDAELYTRNEIQNTPPDILVTNYSMLEYMLARPIERDIFDKTSVWLNADPKNYLTIVLDEAHIYKGVVGSEVAFLLRRLQSRLHVNRNKIRYILTSASLGNEETDKQNVLRFAKELTGKKDDESSFELVSSIGFIEEKANEAFPTLSQQKALSDFDMKKFHTVANDFSSAVQEVDLLFTKIGLGGFADCPSNIVEFKNVVYRKLEVFPPAALLANKLTGKPTSYDTLMGDIFNKDIDSNALECLIALCTFGQLSSTQQVFLPIRLHLMFRGVPGIFVCINRNCKYKHLPDLPSLVGKLYTYPALACSCGGRVFEVLTHRDCGSAYLRGFINHNTSDFLLHEQTSKSSSERLIEAHFLIEPSRRQSAKYPLNWIHIFSGRIYRHNPNSDDFLEVCVSDNQDVIIEGKQLWTFKSSCPVCSRKWAEGKTKIQDLTTKGEAPFSYLVRSQVVEQPASKKVDRKMPLGGRKTLVFSDGRQKAARLARDIPRNVEKDVFRICLVLAIDYLEKNYKTNPSLKHELIYLAFLNVISDKNIILFDGDHRKQLINDLLKLDRYISDGDTFQIMFDEDTWTPPKKFVEMFLVNLFSSYYSISALTIGSIYPSNRVLKKNIAEFTSKIGFESENIAIEVTVNWLNKVIDKQLAFNKDISYGIRKLASGNEYDNFGIVLGSSNRSFFNHLKFLDKSKHKELEEELVSLYCDESDGKYYVNPSKVFVRLNLENAWFQCNSCTRLSFLLIDNMCPHCGLNSTKKLNPNQSEYLRARKGFYRDPVINALKADSKIYNLCVEEHTAQLSYRDDTDLVSTNEYNERRFKDILVDKNEFPVDILSCTTTMEVGVDIGSLIAVSMRNVPPARQNYQQRAGRAGRRGSAISTVLTFAQMGSHDSYYFENPDKIISGNPIVPEIDILNEKVIKRHVIAAIIQSFFHRMKIDKKSENNDLLSVLGLTKDFYVGEEVEFTLNSFEKWLESDFEVSGVKAEIIRWIPSGFSKKTIDQIKDDFIKDLNDAKPDDLEKKDSYEDKFLNFLFSLGLLPSYAFPRHVCAFNIEERNGQYDSVKIVESPQQNLSTALTEYAPGRLVVVNKKTYKIGSITARSSNTEQNRAVALFDKKRRYLQCSNCLFTEDFREDSLNRNTCTHCGKDGIDVLDVIQPEVVYPSGRNYINEYDDDDIYTSASAAQLPFMNDSQPHWEGFKKTAVIASEVDQLLVAINKGDDSSSEQSGFWVCNLCGKASAEKDKPEKYHERDYYVTREPDTRKCQGEIVKVNIGYSFNSDVFILRLPLLEPMQQESIGIEKEGLMTSARTLSEAILQETSVYLEIDPAELNCGIRFLKINSVNFLDIFLYDTSSGGAGYASMAKDHFSTIFSNAIKLLKKNNCCESSCYRCLQNYGNRWHHNFLNKKYGLMLWRKINDDVLPGLYSSSEQISIASSLNKLMALEGWSMITDGSNALLIRKEDRNIKFIIYPVLLDVNFVGKEVGKTVDCLISDYEIEKNLPGAYSKLISA